MRTLAPYKTGAVPIVLDVDVSGASPTGETFSVRADPGQVVGGLVVETPVVLRHPDGSLAMGSRIAITADGVAAGLKIDG